MRKGQLLNSEICYTLAKLGHTDCIAIADAGLPIINNINRIDLALIQGIPSFLQVFDSVAKDMQIERVILAKELQLKNQLIYDAIITRIAELEKQQKNTIAIDFISHEQFKNKTAQCKAIIRTGECSPFANIILQAGVTF